MDQGKRAGGHEDCNDDDDDNDDDNDNGKNLIRNRRAGERPFEVLMTIETSDT